MPAVRIFVRYPIGVVVFMIRRRKLRIDMVVQDVLSEIETTHLEPVVLLFAMWKSESVT